MSGAGIIGVHCCFLIRGETWGGTMPTSAKTSLKIFSPLSDLQPNSHLELLAKVWDMSHQLEQPEQSDRKNWHRPSGIICSFSMHSLFMLYAHLDALVLSGPICIWSIGVTLQTERLHSIASKATAIIGHAVFWLETYNHTCPQLLLLQETDMNANPNRLARVPHTSSRDWSCDSTCFIVCFFCYLQGKANISIQVETN